MDLAALKVGGGSSSTSFSLPSTTAFIKGDGAGGGLATTVYDTTTPSSGQIGIRHDGTDSYFVGGSGKLFIDIGGGVFDFRPRGYAADQYVFRDYIGGVSLRITGSGDLIFRSAAMLALVSETTNYTGALRPYDLNHANGGTWAYETHSPAQITSNQNDYSPDGGALGNFWRVSSDAARDITGLKILLPSIGFAIYMVNVGSNNITFRHQSASSTAEYRFLCNTGGDLVLLPDQMALLCYDKTTTRWRVVLL